MRKEKIVGKREPFKPRFGVLPTYMQRDRTKYTRKAKHKEPCHQKDSHGKHSVFHANFLHPEGARIGGCR